MRATEIVKDTTMQTFRDLSRNSAVPVADLLHIALNISGVSSALPYERGRFFWSLLDKAHRFMAVTVAKDSPFYHLGNRIMLGQDNIGTASEIELDTCDDTYFRHDGRALSLNSNSRSSCRGCKFCGTYSLDSDEEDLTTRNGLEQKARWIKESQGQTDLSFLEAVGIVTGCFRNEQEALEHLLLVNDVFREDGFQGEINYIGSQITTPESFIRLQREGNFSLYLTVECFERREELIKSSKAEVTLERGREALLRAKEACMETSFLYILGLDSLESIRREFPKYLDVLTRHPLVNVLQDYTPQQGTYRHSEARKFDYYIRARKIIENAIAPNGLKPRIWENYRAPWSTEYRGEPLEF